MPRLARSVACMQLTRWMPNPLQKSQSTGFTNIIPACTSRHLPGRLPYVLTVCIQSLVATWNWSSKYRRCFYWPTFVILLFPKIETSIDDHHVPCWVLRYSKWNRVSLNNEFRLDCFPFASFLLSRQPSSWCLEMPQSGIHKHPLQSMRSMIFPSRIQNPFFFSIVRSTYP